MDQASLTESGTWGLLLFFAVLTYPSVFLLGVPAFRLYQNRGLTSVKAYIIGGAAIGLVSILFWSTIFNFQMIPSFVGLFILAGVLSALTFRIIARPEMTPSVGDVFQL